MQKILMVRDIYVENVGEDSEIVSRRRHRVSDVPSSRFQTQSWSYGGLTVVLRWSYDSSHGKLPRTFHLQRYGKCWRWAGQSDCMRE